MDHGSNLVLLQGILQQVVFYNEENGYAVVRLTDEQGEEHTATGILPGILPGEQVSLTGHWIQHPSYGEQLSVARFDRALPDTEGGIAQYLSAGLLYGIGPKMAQRIAKHFGVDTFDILETQPDRLTELRGISEKRARELGRQYTAHHEMRVLMYFLNEHQIPIALTPTLYNNLRGNAVAQLTQNPYLLCEDGYEVDFDLADRLAMSLGLSPLSEARGEAGILYTLRVNMRNGHTFVPLHKLLDAVCRLLCTSEVIYEDTSLYACIERLAEQQKLVRQTVAGCDAVYLYPLYHAEVQLADTLHSMAQTEYPLSFDPALLVDTIAADSQTVFSSEQRRAIATAATKGLVILTGGPGTGKTTTVRGILQLFDMLSLQTVLAAPTGRAAKRLSDLSGVEAKTMHRLLEASFGANGHTVFARGAGNPLTCDALILDEVSMVDIVLMQALLDALPHHARLVLVGDVDQLPPVGPGNFLCDLLGAAHVPTVRLTEVFRQAQQSAIVCSAHAVNRGQMPESADAEGDFFILPCVGAANVVHKVVELCTRRLPDYYGLATGQIQVLTPTRKFGSSTECLNPSLQAALNPPSEGKKEKTIAGRVFREGDRVMQMRNNYDLAWERGEDEVGMGIFNGDVGQIVHIQPASECMIVRFDDRYVTYPFAQVGELELAYAITVHKAQGSEFEAVVLALSDDMPPKLLTRSILYTAITRARRLLVIVGSRQVLARMVQNDRKRGRYSALRARICAQWTDKKGEQE